MSGSASQPGRAAAADHRRLALKRVLRDLALLLCAALAAYLLTAMIVSRLAVAVAGAVERASPPWYLALIVAALMDLTKLVGLLPTAWVVRRAVALRPLAASAVLVLLYNVIDLGVMALLQQAAWSFARPAIGGVRLFVLVLSLLLVNWVMRRSKVQKSATS